MQREVLGGRIRGTPAIALLRANARFWPTVLPDVRRELRRWDRRAAAIPDPALRAQALAKLRQERCNAEVAATLATLVPPPRRRRAVEAIVALQVMYDYLDGLTEQPSADPLAGARRLHRAFVDAFTLVGPRAGYYASGAGAGAGGSGNDDDGGYLAALVETCRHGLRALPAAPVIAPVARGVVTRCGEAQARTHAVAHAGVEQLRAWARAQPEARALQWHEVAAGAAASVLAAHALIALAGDARTTTAHAQAVADAYLATCALTTLLDSLIDADADAASGGHAYLAYYRDEAEAAARLRVLARTALAAAAELPGAPHHHMTVGGAVAFYLSAPAAGGARARRLTAPLIAELGPLLGPTLAVFALWRCARGRARPRRAREIGRTRRRLCGDIRRRERPDSGEHVPMHTVSATTPRHRPRTLGSQLERDRLERRAARVRQVIRALRERAAARDTAGGAPRPLRAAIDDFGRELAELERRLHHRTPAAGGPGR